ncbi:DinB family protein [Streptomyces sp. B21-083]|uniref:DinB family protein n=1 Tax=Streptomyces sp. B21-083 TaxID=3039410 RepID=UPI002FF217F4
MIDGFAKEYLHGDLREIREAMLWKLDGLGEYDVRRPLTATGTNLLGLVKHLSICESRYFGEVFDRPFPEPLPWWDDAGDAGADMWATEYETRDETVDRYRRVWEHSDATITALALDSPGHVPWWPRPDVKLFNILVHMLTETSRHAGHADILREQLDESTGTTARYATPQRDPAYWEAHRSKIERAATAAVTKPDHADRSDTDVYAAGTATGSHDIR